MRVRLLATFIAFAVVAAAAWPALVSAQCRMKNGEPCECPHDDARFVGSSPSIAGTCCASVQRTVPQFAEPKEVQLPQKLLLDALPIRVFAAAHISFVPALKAGAGIGVSSPVIQVNRLLLR